MATSQKSESSEVQILKDLVNSSLVSSRTRKELLWFGFPGLVCFSTQGKKIQGLSVPSPCKAGRGPGDVACAVKAQMSQH